MSLIEKKLMNLCKVVFLIVFVLVACQQPIYADDQPSTASQPQSLTHATKLGAALDQPGIPITISREQAGSISGKISQLVRGIYPVAKDFTLYVNGLSVTSSDSAALTAKGLEIKIAYTIKGGNYKNIFVSSRFVDVDDIPKLQQFIATMEAEAIVKTRDEKDHTENTYITPGYTTFGFVRNGRKDSDYYVLNAPNTVYDFRLKSGNDVAKLQSIVNDAATWVQSH